MMTETIHEPYLVLIHKALDGQISPEERGRLDEHLHACPVCRAIQAREHAFARRLAQDMPLIGIGNRQPVSGELLLERMERAARRKMTIRLAAGLAGLLVVAAAAGLLWAFASPQPAALPTAPAPTRPVVIPQVSPDAPGLSGLLAYESWESGDAEVFTVRPDGTQRQNLTNAPSYEGLPVASPDGRMLALVSDRGSGPAVFLLDLAGGPLRALTEARQADPGWSEMAWSPDGRSLAAVQALKRGEGGSSGYNIQRGDRADASRAYDGSNEGTLYVLGLEGSIPVRVSDRLHVAWGPQWSPDGSRLYYNASVYGYGRIFSVRADGADIQPVGEPGGAVEQGAFALSPDGTQIAYFALRRSRGSRHADELILANTDGSNPRVLRTFKNRSVDLGRLVRFGYIAWSPDGTRLAFLPPDANTPVLKLINPQTGKETALFEDINLGLPGHEPVWSPDGRHIALTVENRIYILNALDDLSQGETPLVKVYESAGDQPLGNVQWMVENPAQSQPGETRPVCDQPHTYAGLEGVVQCRQQLHGVVLDVGMTRQWVLEHYREVLIPLGWRETSFSVQFPRITFRKGDKLILVQAMAANSPFLYEILSPGANTQVQVWWFQEDFTSMLSCAEPALLAVVDMLVECRSVDGGVLLFLSASWDQTRVAYENWLMETGWTPGSYESNMSGGTWTRGKQMLYMQVLPKGATLQAAGGEPKEVAMPFGAQVRVEIRLVER